MNILLLSRMVAKSGVGNHMKQLANELTNQGHSVWIVTGCNTLDTNGLNNRGGYFR